MNRLGTRGNWTQQLQAATIFTGLLVGLLVWPRASRAPVVDPAELMVASARRLDAPAVGEWLQAHRAEAGTRAHTDALRRAAWESGMTASRSPIEAAKMEAVWNALTDSRADPDGPVCREVLRMAAMRRATPVVARLLARGTTPNFGAPFEYPPLYWAATQLDFPTTRLLLEKGADANIRYSYARLARQGPVTTLVVLEDRLVDAGPRNGAPATATQKKEQAEWRKMIHLLKSHGAHGAGDGPVQLLPTSPSDSF